MRIGILTLLAVCVVLRLTPELSAATPAGIAPLGLDGKALNLDFESGTLKDWTAEGNAFEQQPIKGDTVSVRRSDMKSQHQGNFWIGTFERGGDDLTGTLTSARFKVTQPWASFLVSGGLSANTCVELIDAATQKVFFKISGYESENLRPVVVDLKAVQGKEIFIRLVDQHKGGWGHLNFDNFQFHAQRPKFDQVLVPAEIAKQQNIPPADEVLFAGLSSEDAATRVTLPPGFKMHLFAGEPDVMQPIAFCLDDRGRVWVAEGYTYPKRMPEGQGKDRILVFEDTDGDGKFNKRTVFMEGLNLVSGLQIGFGGVWIGAAPYLMFVPVGDWDNPKPASAPKILLDGWDYLRDTHETLNTFTWGPDGWLYGCHGVFCPSFVGKPGTPENERQRVDAAVWRYHPTKHVFEVFAEGTSNPWGVDFNEQGQCIIEACVIPHLWHMIQGGRYQRQGGQHYSITAEEKQANDPFTQRNAKFVQPFIYDDIKTIADHVHYAGDKGPHAGNGRSDAMGGGHAHAGLMVYLGESWPKEYRGMAFMNNIHGARLNMDLLKPAGSGFVGQHGADFAKFNDAWSQILNLTYDQDGSVYLIDWYDKNQCHHNDVNGHDRNNGRIFKIVYNNQKTTRVDLQKLSDDELVRLVSSKNEFMSRHARRVLQERGGGKNVEVGLEKLLSPSQPASARLRSLWALHTTGGLDDAQRIALLGDKDEFIRAWTIQLLAEDRNPTDKALGSMRKLARDDKSAVVRLYLASALQRITLEKRWDIYHALVQHGNDSKDHNIPLMLWYAGEPLAASSPDKALDVALEAQIPNILNFTTRRVATINSADAFGIIVRHLAKTTRADQQLDMLNGLASALKGQRNVPMPAGWSELERKLAASANAAVRAQAQSLSLTFGSVNALAALRKTVIDKNSTANVRRAALDSLLGAKDPALAPVLQELIADVDLRGTALKGLAGYDDPSTPEKLLAAYSKFSGSQKRDALNTLAARNSFAIPLMAAVESNRVPRADLTAELIRQLRSLKSPALDQQIQTVWGAYRDSSADKQKLIEKYKAIYRAGGSTPGDASRGRGVFTRLCAQCHTLFDVGGKVGPDLTGSNRGDLDYILQNMADPNAVIPNDYRTSTLDMKDDRVITGIIKQQGNQSVTVVTPNETLTLSRADIKAIQQNELSMMPEGLMDSLQEQEVRDLIYYLGRPGQVALPAGTK